jgi:hypothetical protein
MSYNRYITVINENFNLFVVFNYFLVDIYVRCEILEMVPTKQTVEGEISFQQEDNSVVFSNCS